MLCHNRPRKRRDTFSCSDEKQEAICFGYRCCTFQHSWSIKLWDIETRQCVRTFANYARSGSFCRVVAIDNESFVCFFYDIDVLVLYNIAIDNHVKTIELLDNGTFHEKQFAVLDRDRFLTGNDSGDVKVWSFGTGECQRTLHFEDNYIGIHSISKFDDESFLCGFYRTVLLCNVETGEVMKSFDADGQTNQIAVVDRKRFLTVQRVCQGNTWCPKVNVWNANICTMINVWNANSGELIQRLSTDSEVLQAIPVHGHGVLLSYYINANIELRGDEMRNVKRCFVGHEDDVCSIDVVTDATFISASHDGTIKIWDLSRWSDLKTLICLRKLFILGRADKVPHDCVQPAKGLKRLGHADSKKLGRDEISPFLHALVCETSADTFRTVLSFLA